MGKTKHNVLVYGTLKKGFGNWARLLAPWLNTGAVEYKGERIARGYKVICMGGCPRVQTQPQAATLGELYQVSTRVLRRLDGLEGHPHMYERKVVDVETLNGEVEQAWLYIMESDGFGVGNQQNVCEILEGVESWG